MVQVVTTPMSMWLGEHLTVALYAKAVGTVASRVIATGAIIRRKKTDNRLVCDDVSYVNLVILVSRAGRYAI